MFSIRYILSLGWWLLWLPWAVNAPSLQNAAQTIRPLSANITRAQVAAVSRYALPEAWETGLLAAPEDTPIYRPNRFPTYQPEDRYGDPFANPRGRSRLFSPDPPSLKQDLDFSTDPSGRRIYRLDERLGSGYYRPPTLIDEENLNRSLDDEAKDEFWRETASGVEGNKTLGGRNLLPNIPLQNRLLGRIFGGDYIEFTPAGFVNLDFGARIQRVANPTLTLRQQRNFTFNFAPHANVSLQGKVGEKLNLRGTFDTKAGFEFENQFKLEYNGLEHEIIRKIEFGNVSFPLNTTLIQGAQNLFGVNTHLQFGRLGIRAVYSNQRARAEQVVLEGRGGAQRRNFEIRADNYDVNRHFFLGQFFRDIYEPSLSTLPIISSRVTITRIEVYVTNRTNNTETLRNVIGLLDLGEADKAARPANPNVGPIRPGSPTANRANALFDNLINLNNRSADNISRTLETSFGLQRGFDFEVLRAARKLSEREFTFQPELGYISLLTPLRNDEILAVAFEYTFNGQVFKVGELTEDYQTLPQDQAVFLKLLRPSTIDLESPTWDLMMKNIYQLNASQINRQNFQLRVVYRDDITGLNNPALQEGQNTAGIPLLRLLNLDQLNPQNDPFPDGNFDFVDRVTMDAVNGRVIFPVVEPFGAHLERQFNPVTEAELIGKYVFRSLYRSTQADALQDASKNKFFIIGSFEGSATSEVQLPGLNISPGSVVVTAGGIPLVEGTDYTVDYATGSVNIINESVRASGKEIKIDFEQADLFNFQTRRLWGLRADYEFSKNFVLGATMMNLSERPVITRNNVGSDPVNNTIWGLDVNYEKESRFLTRLVDRIPFIQTKAKSSVSFYGEFAQLRPGASPFSGQVAFIDDFEGTRTTFNFVRAPHANWKIASTPQLFPQGTTDNPLEAGYRRGKLAWYNVDNLFYRGDGFNNLRPSNITGDDIQNHYERAVVPQEIFQNQDLLPVNTNELIFDMAFFPHERGPYNYNPDLTPDGLLPNPQQSWGGITRAITSDIDFDNANVEYIEFWMLDPFIAGERGRVLDGRFNTNNTTGGDLYINLGNVSEDVLKDGRQSFENGLPADGSLEGVVENEWGRVTNRQFITNAFDNNPGSRPNQDVGFDGLNSENERNYFQNFVNTVSGRLGGNALSELLSDVSADDFQYYLGAAQDNANAKIVQRYKNFNGLEGNSPIGSAGAAFNESATNEPDNEDLNRDNTLNELEAYYQYRISLRPQDLQVGRNYIIDRVEATVNNGQDRVNWYLFRIPIRQFDDRVGNINGFKSIRYLRMFVTNFQQPAVLRFARYQMVANQWRQFLGDLTARGLSEPNEPYDPQFDVSTVNIEENGAFVPGITPYVLPPGVIRDIDVTNINNRRINEQSLRISLTDLRDRDARAVFRNYDLNLLSYKNLNMYIHAESDNAIDGELTAFVRLGTDFVENYYEVEVPLTMTPRGSTSPEIIWPRENEIDIPLAELVNTKIQRNQDAGQRTNLPFSREVGRYRVTVVGNPEISAVQTVLMGVRNPDLGANDDRLPKSVEVWFNELRVTGFEQTSGWAALARTNVQLADFAQITGAARYTTFGFGQIQQSISERAFENTLEYDITANVALDKFFPQRWGLRIPLFVSYQRRSISPFFNPLDPDVPLQNYLNLFESNTERQDYRRIVEDNTTRRSINLTNVRKEKTGDSKSRFYDISNFSASVAYSDEVRTDQFIAQFLFQSYQASLNYAYSREAKSIEPFSKMKLFQSPWLKLIGDFNFNPFPNSVLVRGDLNRNFQRILYRGPDLTTEGVVPLFEKQFLFNRLYDVQWDLTKSLNINYNAATNAIIDEPFGDLDTQEKRDSVLNNFLRLGRVRNFNQQINAAYQLPFNKIPLTSFINANIGYNIGYQWTAGPLGIADSLGNTLSNNRGITANGRLDFVRLYRNTPILRNLEAPRTDLPMDSLTPSQRLQEMIRLGLKPLLMIRSFNITYALQQQTTITGFMMAPSFFGLDSTFTQPGLDFVLGSQDPNIRFRLAEQGLISRSGFLNAPFLQNWQETVGLRATLEPFKDFRITLDAQRRQTVGFQEIFRFDTEGQDYNSFNPLRTGSYTVSSLMLFTSFVAPDNARNESPNFRRFEQNRSVILTRLRGLNTNQGEYGLNSQDVLVPAFLAAYTDQDPNSIRLSAAQPIPLPNWRIDYNGLAKLPFFKEYLASFTLTHAYNSTYTIGNFASSLQYVNRFNGANPMPDFRYLLPDSLNEQGEFIPVTVMSQITLAERFAPLVGVNFRTKTNWTVRLDYNRERILNLNMSNAQVTENRSQDIVIGIGYNKRGLRLPFKRDGQPIVLKNDFNMRIDVTLRDSDIVQRQLDNEQTVTGGNFNFQLKPVMSYAANQRLNVQLYYEYTTNSPKISSSFPRNSTAFGVQLRYNLVQ